MSEATQEGSYPKFGFYPWHGLPLSTYLRLLRVGGFAVSPARLFRAFTILVAAAVNSVLNRIDQAIFGRRAVAVELSRPPLFILGHWRTGSTLLHELLSCDPRLHCPDYYQCMAPKHFLMTQRLLPPLISWLLPKQRPMDAMPVALDKPAEDEFALSNQGVPTPYWDWLYPDRALPFDGYLDLSDLSLTERQAWQQALLLFAKRLTLKDPRMLVLKSPPHTARIAALLEIFPHARFVHLVRDPQAIIPSTIRTWRQLGLASGLRLDTRTDLMDHVLQNFSRVERAYVEQRPLIGDERFFELHYEDLVKDPLGCLEQLYRALSLGDLTEALPGIETYLAERADYRTNRFAPDRALERRIAATCAGYAARYGYTANTCRSQNLTSGSAAELGHGT